MKRGHVIAIALVVAVGLILRVWNAFLYPTNWGFDAVFNWEYVELLRQSWALRAPDTAWATSHPPLYYYTAAGLNHVLGYPAVPEAVARVRLLNVGATAVTIAFFLLLVRRLPTYAGPDSGSRALLGCLVLLFLPAHIYMSAMINEEILASAFISAAVFGTALAARAELPPRQELGRAALIGAAAGLAWATKLTGVLVVVVAAGTYAWLGWRRSALPAAFARIGVLGACAIAFGGWYYLHNLATYGYLYPYAMPAHSLMFGMPPGERTLLDYVYFPAATFTDPQLLAPDLLRSVWGSTYATLWYDGHRFFLPRTGAAQAAWGTRITLLGLLPTAAFLAGAVYAVRRVVREVRAGRTGGADVPLLGLIALTFAGYVLFTWRNPWFASVKGSYLLGLSVPYAVYASEALARWSGGVAWRRALVGLGLGLLVLCVLFVFTFGLFLRKTSEVPGLFWEPEEAA